MTAEQTKINAVHYTPRAERLVTVLESPEFTAKMTDARAVLAGIRREKEDQMTFDQTYNPGHPPQARRPWYRRPAWQIGGAAVGASLLLCCGVSAVVGVAGDSDDGAAPAPVQTSLGHTDAPASSEPSAAGSPSARVRPAYILEVTGPGRASVTWSAASASSTQTVKLPWRREVAEVDGFIGITVVVEKVTAAKPVSCKLTHRDDDGDLKVIAEAKTEPGEFATISCDKFF